MEDLYLASAKSALKYALDNIKELFEFETKSICLLRYHTLVAYSQLGLSRFLLGMVLNANYLPEAEALHAQIDSYLARLLELAVSPDSQLVPALEKFANDSLESVQTA